MYMEIQETGSRVSVGFPLSLGLLFALLLLLCGFMCCCLHWQKFHSLVPCCGVIASFLLQPPHHHSSLPLSQSHHLPIHKPQSPFQMRKQSEAESLPVLMPGDKVPKFIALACPCQPPKEDHHQTLTIIQLQNPPTH